MEIKKEIFGIFPTPVYVSMLHRNLNKKEIMAINKLKKNKNKGNTVSENSYVLELPIFNNLKKELNVFIKDYFKNVLTSNDNTEPYITQSWINYTKKNEFHHEHKHPNSLISGVFYINADDKNDSIKFYKDNYQQIELVPEQWNLFTSTLWWFAVKTKNIFLFPSSLKHSVDIKKGNNLRISLAFNIFIKGSIGIEKELNKLIL
jgi:uncharacterized protein (TIGR02466 family)